MESYMKLQYDENNNLIVEDEGGIKTYREYDKQNHLISKKRCQMFGTTELPVSVDMFVYDGDSDKDLRLIKIVDSAAHTVTQIYYADLYPEGLERILKTVTRDRKFDVDPDTSEPTQTIKDYHFVVEPDTTEVHITRNLDDKIISIKTVSCYEKYRANLYCNVPPYDKYIFPYNEKRVVWEYGNLESGYATTVNIVYLYNNKLIRSSVSSITNGNQDNIRYVYDQDIWYVYDKDDYLLSSQICITRSPEASVDEDDTIDIYYYYYDEFYGGEQAYSIDHYHKANNKSHKYISFAATPSDDKYDITFYLDSDIVDKTKSYQVELLKDKDGNVVWDKFTYKNSHDSRIYRDYDENQNIIREKVIAKSMPGQQILVTNGNKNMSYYKYNEANKPILAVHHIGTAYYVEEYIYDENNNLIEELRASDVEEAKEIYEKLKEEVDARIDK